MKHLFAAIKETVIESLDLEMADHLVLSLSYLVDMLVRKKREGVDCELIKKHCATLLDFILSALAAFQSFKLQRKEEPQSVVKSRDACMQVIRQLAYLHDDNEVSQDGGLGSYFEASVERVWQPFRTLADNARKWFVEETHRDRVRAEEEAKWRAEQKELDDEAAI